MSQAPLNNLYNSPTEQCVEEDNTTPSKESLLSNQMMDTDNAKEFRKNVEGIMDKSKIPEEEITFLPSRLIYRPVLSHQTFTANDVHTPDLPFIFWALICLPLPPKPKNSTNMIFEAINKFFTKMQEADKKFTVFPHH